MSKILVVDDEVECTEAVKLRLEAEGHQVFVLNTGEGAFELAKKVKPDIAIIDILLPVVTGYQLCRKMRRDPELYRAGILVITALGEEPEILHALDQGADDHLVKPFKFERLMEKVAGIEALRDAIEKLNPLTKLPGTEAIKREIDLRLVRGTPIAVAYIDVVGFKPYCAARGAEGQKRALLLASEMLTGLMRPLDIYESYVAHMGGAHFAVLLNIEDANRFCPALGEHWDRGVHQLYTQQEVTQGFILATDRRGQEAKCPLMALSIGVAHTQHRSFANANRLFEVLAQVRLKAQPDAHTAVFFDRRRTDR